MSSGMLYSRNLALKAELMHNDNASRQIIDCTKSDVTDCVRFYFRPLTPTQYYNEGFKHKDIRYEEEMNGRTSRKAGTFFGGRMSVIFLRKLLIF